jgi:integrase
MDGNEVRESARTESETKARRLLLRRLGEVQNKSFIQGQDRVRFGVLLDGVVRDYEVNAKKDLKNVKYRLQRVRDAFGDVRAIHVTAERIEKFKQDLLTKEKLKPATVNRSLAIIRRAFRLGIRQKLITSMPFVDALEENNVREGFLTPADFEAVSARLPPVLADVARFAFASSWRRREVTGLKWKDVDLNQRIITLSWRRSKTGRPRVLPIEGDLLAILVRRKEARAMPRSSGGFALAEFVFHRSGKEIKDFRAEWDKACTAAGLPGTWFHDLRRSGIRCLVRGGTPERICMGVSGHVTRATFDRYNIVDESDMRLALKRAQAYVDANKGTEPRSVTPDVNENTDKSRTIGA